MLATIHQNLTEVINIINQVYSVLLMFYFCGIFCAMNLFVFGLVITRAYYTTHSEVVIMTMANFEWNMYDMIMVFFVIRYSVAASEEGKKAMNLIYKIVNTSMDGKLNGRVREWDRHSIFCCSSTIQYLHSYYRTFFFAVDEFRPANCIESLRFLMWTFQLWLATLLQGRKCLKKSTFQYFFGSNYSLSAQLSWVWWF